MTQPENINSVPPPTAPESRGELANPYLEAIEASRQRVAAAADSEHQKATINGMESDVDVEAERYAQAANFGRKDTSLEEPNIVTAEQIRGMLRDGRPSTRESLDRMLARYEDVEKESAAKAESDSIRPFTPEEVFKVNRMGETEAKEALDALNRTSVEVLDSNPTNNSGIGNRDFAIARLNANTIEAQLHNLAGYTPDIDQAEHDARADELIAEGKLWQKIVNGEQITLQESFQVGKHARELRKAYRQHPEAEQTQTTQPEQKPAGYEDLVDSIPTDDKERKAFMEREFGKGYDPAKQELYKAYIVTQIRLMAEGVREPVKLANGDLAKRRYPDTSGTMLGTALDGSVRYLGELVSQRNGGKPVTVEELGVARFSKLCKDYLDLDVFKDMPDYDQHFNPAAGTESVF